MFLPRHCPKCGDIIGIVNDRIMSLAAEGCIGHSVFKKPDVKGFFDFIDREQGLKDVQWDKNASCKGSHGSPVKETIGRKLGGLIKVEQTTYPDGSCSSPINHYIGPSSGRKFLMLLIYVKVFRNDVYGKEWIWPFLSVSEIKAKVAQQ